MKKGITAFRDSSLCDTVASVMKPSLIAFDMDSTLIACETLDRFAELRGVGSQIATITAQAMQGKIDFKASLQKRCALLKGLSMVEVQKILEAIPFTEGAEELIQGLHKRSIHTALITGGPQVIAEPIARHLGISHVVSNQFEFDSNGYFTGHVTPPLVDASYKAHALNALRTQLNIPQAESVAVGDGANDIEMLKTAGIGVAFHAKPVLTSHADIVISEGSLLQLIPALGL